MRKSIVILMAMLWMVGSALRAQEYPSFIRVDSNRLHYDTASLRMKHMSSRWEEVTSLGKGNFNIVHIGASHVQGGTFPHRIRMNLLKRHPNLVGSRGMIFPYSAAAKCNNPADYKVHCVEKVTLTRNVYKEPEQRLGLCGIAITAHDTTTSIAIVCNEWGVNFNADRIVVLGESPDHVIPELLVEDRRVPPSYIDSATRRFVYNLYAPADSFTIVLPCDTAQTFTLTGVYVGNRKAGISYHSIGVNGASCEDYLKCPFFTCDLKMLKPDLVIFGIGINDASGPNFDTAVFANNYRRLVDSVRSVNPNCAIIFITNNDSFRKSVKRVKRRRRTTYLVNDNGELVRETFYRLAKECDAAVWDQFEIMGGLRSMALWERAHLAQRDKVHFTRAGYELMGDLMTSALLRTLNAPGEKKNYNDNSPAGR